MTQITKRCQDCLQLIKLKQEDIIKVLTKIETLSMAKDEIVRCVDLLENIEVQRDYLKKVYDSSMSSFLPLNQPMYSYLLQVFLPSLILKRVYFRPPASQVDIYVHLYQILEDVSENIDVRPISRREFLHDCVLKSDIVNFTGKYDSVVELMHELPKDCSVVYNGSAINPIVIGADAVLDNAITDSIAARLYNSGQDCMAPACIFVDRRISCEFLEKLKKHLSLLNVGNNGESNAEIGPMLEKESLILFQEFKQKHMSNLRFGGKISESDNFIYPTVFLFEQIDSSVQQIYYAPYFIVMEYDFVSEINEYLGSKYCELYAGYISLYGKSLHEHLWKSGASPLIPLFEKTLFSAEDGNSPFGGYGKGCSFVCHNGTWEARPVLLLREINKIME